MRKLPGEITRTVSLPGQQGDFYHGTPISGAFHVRIVGAIEGEGKAESEVMAHLTAERDYEEKRLRGSGADSEGDITLVANALILYHASLSNGGTLVGVEPAPGVMEAWRAKAKALIEFMNNPPEEVRSVRGVERPATGWRT